MKYARVLSLWYSSECASFTFNLQMKIYIYSWENWEVEFLHVDGIKLNQF